MQAMCFYEVQYALYRVSQNCINNQISDGFAIVKLFGNTLCKLRHPLIKSNVCKTFMPLNFKGYLKVRHIKQQNKNE